MEEHSVAAADSYELTAKSLHGDDSALDATNADGGATADGRQLKRFVMPVAGLDMGHDTSSSRPYFTQYQPSQRQKHQQHLQPPYQSPVQQSRQYHQHGRPPVNERFNFGPSSPDGGGAGGGRGGGGRGVGGRGSGGRGYNDQSENYYQSDGENTNFDQNGFTNFVPSVGFRSTASPIVSPSSLPYAPSPQIHLSSTYSSSPQQSSSFATPSPSSPPYSSLFDESSSGGHHDVHSYDPSGYGHESPSPGYSNTGGGGSVSTGYDYSPPAPQHQAPIIHKSIYVHVAPPDDEPPRKQRVIMPYAPPKKNYQIVFIKAPTSPPPTVPIIPPPPQHSDKTLIYVLHPKHEEAPPIHIPPPPVQKPIKPEVYFIKYKHREEPSHGSGSGAGGDYGAGHGGGGGGGQLPSPGEEFSSASGGEIHSGSYLHRRYGRNDKKSETPLLSPTVAAVDDGGGYSDDGGGGGGESNYNDSGGAMAELRELTEVAATVSTASATAFDRTTAADADGYSFDRTTEAAANEDAFGRTVAVDDATRRESVAMAQRGGDGSSAAEYGDASVETPPRVQAEPETEHNDASVESSVNRARYVLMSTDVPKGKNGH